MNSVTEPRRILFWLLLALAACTTSSPGAPDVLLFSGAGTSPNDVAALEDILRAQQLRYTIATWAHLQSMSDSELSACKLVIVPGGDFEQMGSALSADAATKLKAAIKGGVGYLGVCAGAFLAGASPIAGLNLTGGVRFSFYALANQGIRKAPVTVTTATGAEFEAYWEDGPQLTGWGESVARYPDRTPAAVHGRFGAGHVILTGVHFEAPERWRRGLGFKTSAGSSRAFAITLIEAALARWRLTPN